MGEGDPGEGVGGRSRGIAAVFCSMTGQVDQTRVIGFVEWLVDSSRWER